MSGMWHLRVAEISTGQFSSIGDFETAGAAAQRINELEGRDCKSVFFEVQVGAETDYLALGFLTYHATKSGRRYIVQRREPH